MLIKKYILIIILSFFVGFFSYPLIFPNNKENIQNTPSQTSSKNTEDQKKERGNEPYIFEGEGIKTIGPMRFENQLVILQAKNLTGKNDSFSVEIILDENGNGKLESGEGWTGAGISVAYSEAETFDGKIAFKVIPGKDYYINIDGGRWEIRANSYPELSQKAQEFNGFAGSSIQVSEKFFLPEGIARFRATNKGNGLFIVQLIDEKGNATSRLVNNIGDYDDVFEYKVVFPGNYIFSVSGNNWNISYEN